MALVPLRGPLQGPHWESKSEDTCSVRAPITRHSQGWLAGPWLGFGSGWLWAGFAFRLSAGFLDSRSGLDLAEAFGWIWLLAFIY